MNANRQEELKMKILLAIMILQFSCLATASAQDDSTQLKPVDFPPKEFEVSSVTVTFKSPNRDGILIGEQTRVPDFAMFGEVLIPVGELTIEGKWNEVPDDKTVVPCNLEIVFESRPIDHVKKISERAKEEGWPLDWQIDDKREQKNQDVKPEKNKKAEESKKSRVSKFKHTVRVDVPVKTGKCDISVPFSFQWNEENNWKVDYYYSVHATHPKIDIATTHAGMFQVTQPPKKSISSQAKKVTYYILKFIGSDPDPRYWLFEKPDVK
jgi:hypothetical protein